MFEPVIHQVEISGPQMEQMVVLPEGATTIGRDATNDLIFVHPLISRKHVELVVAAETCRLTDLGSTHGTLVNRETIEAETAVILSPGDIIEIGAFRLVYKRTEIAAAKPEPTIEPIVTAETVASEEVKEEDGETAVSEPSPTHQPAPEATQSPPPQTPRQTPPLTSPMQDWKTARYIPVTSGDGNGSNNGKLTTQNGDEPFHLPPGQSFTYSRYLEYLPEIYRTSGETFIPRFLAMLESILAPVEWTGDNFDLFLDCQTAPLDFLPWLANWYELYFDPTWSETAQRTVLQEAYLIYQRRGTAWSLQRLLEIYTSTTVQIEDLNENLEGFTFSVRISASSKTINRSAVEKLINANKPAHTSYDLLFIK
jgi:phage tail-like protein